MFRGNPGLTGIAPPHVLAAARSAEPLADVTQYKFPSNRWRRYDKLARTPDGKLDLEGPNRPIDEIEPFAPSDKMPEFTTVAPL